jgi:hypothetical protein
MVICSAGVEGKPETLRSAGVRLPSDVFPVLWQLAGSWPLGSQRSWLYALSPDSLHIVEDGADYSTDHTPLNRLPASFMGHVPL